MASKMQAIFEPSIFKIADSNKGNGNFQRYGEIHNNKLNIKWSFIDCFVPFRSVRLWLCFFFFLPSVIGERWRVCCRITLTFFKGLTIICCLSWYLKQPTAIDLHLQHLPSSIGPNRPKIGLQKKKGFRPRNNRNMCKNNEK